MENKNDKVQLWYLLPNFFTAASAFLGVLSIVAASNDMFGKAALYLFLALIFDGLDGRIARLTNTSSKFGVEFDSLADIVSFGVAPAMFFYYSVGDEFGRIGAVLAALYVVFGAIRLARFNVMSPSSEPSVFIGVPIPTAAVLVVTWGYLFQKYSISSEYYWILLALQVVASVLMVSNIRFPSFKKMTIQKAHRLRLLTFLVVILMLVYFRPAEVLGAMATLYVIYGLVRVTYNIIVAKIKKNRYNS
jgi:CDP-diacylglycerol--serine O-phosphatidyltransferase